MSCKAAAWQWEQLFRMHTIGGYTAAAVPNFKDKWPSYNKAMATLWGVEDPTPVPEEISNEDIMRVMMRATAHQKRVK